MLRYRYRYSSDTHRDRYSCTELLFLYFATSVTMNNKYEQYVINRFDRAQNNENNMKRESEEDQSEITSIEELS